MRRTQPITKKAKISSNNPCPLLQWLHGKQQQHNWSIHYPVWSCDPHIVPTVRPRSLVHLSILWVDNCRLFARLDLLSNRKSGRIYRLLTLLLRVCKLKKSRARDEGSTGYPTKVIYRILCLLSHWISGWKYRTSTSLIPYPAGSTSIFKICNLDLLY